MINVVLCWHMHQPDYRHHGAYLRPWTWLHAIKDYSDMAAHLEDIQGARAVVNFSPVLMLQLQDIARRLNEHLESGVAIGDAILDALAGQPDPSFAWQDLLRALRRVNETTMKARFEPYARLHEQAGKSLAENRPMADTDLRDLLVWYVLVWMGESLRQDSRVLNLHTKQRDFSATDCRALLRFLAEIIGQLLPRYRKLAESGRIELSVTPFSHPIIPLLLDMNTASEAMPGARLPGGAYPGGKQRCDWQMEQAIRVFRAVFGTSPAGCWPSEGGLSDATVALLSDHGFAWSASGARVLANSIEGHDGLAKLSAWTVQPQPGASSRQNEVAPMPGRSPVTLFFRDDELSDRIGFEYSRWDAQAAVDDFIQQVEQRHDAWLASPARGLSKHEEAPVLSIIMDGENAWEYFPENARAFLTGLYQKLAQHPRITLTTFSDMAPRTTVRTVPALVAGSWVYGTFSTWVGDAAKNRAWDLLIQAKQAVDTFLGPVLQHAEEAGEPLPEAAERILQQLSVCEASDWFWWLGEDNRLEDGPAFDRLFRQQLAGLYESLGMTPPATLDQAVNHPAAYDHDHARAHNAGAMKQANEVSGLES